MGFRIATSTIGGMLTATPQELPPMDVELVIERGSTKRQTIRLRAAESVVGRLKGSDLRIPSAQVSRRHCRLYQQDDFLMVEDLGSANGTYLNGERVDEAQIVRPGDHLEVGPVTFLVKYQLTQAGIDRLMQMDLGEPLPTLEVEEVTELEEVVPEAAPIEIEPELETVDLQGREGDTTNEPAEVVAEAEEITESTEALTADIFDDATEPWHMPAGEDIR